MYTRCPKCSTCFRVTDRHLAIANGKVRCGQCQHVFNAMQHAIDDPQQPSTVKASGSTPAQTMAQTTTQAVTRVQPVTPATKIKTEEKIVEIDKQNVEVKPERPAASITETKPELEEITITAQQSQSDLSGREKSQGIKPGFNPDETMLADISMVDNEDINEINLDVPTEEVREIFIDEEEDDFFDDSFDDEPGEDSLNDEIQDDLPGNDIDLDSAIEELTQANKIAPINTTESFESKTYSVSAEDKENIFSTDAYDATSASSVADIFNEMEGQLSLDIDAATPVQEEDDEDEFDIFGSDEEENIAISTLHGEDYEKSVAENISREKSIEEQFIDELELGKNVPVEDVVDADELFDEIDLSDFDDDKVEEALPQENLTHSNKNNDNEAEDNAVPFQLRNDLEKLQTPARRQLHPVFSILIILLLLTVTFAQLAYFRAYEVVKILPASRPLLEDFCSKIHCVYSGPRDIKQIKLLNRDVRQHPKEKNALLITATMINQASFAQPYPDIHIRLSDISGNVVAERTFNAKTYMGKLSNPFLLMKSKTPVHLDFEVVDPGKDAVNFEFTFK